MIQYSNLFIINNQILTILNKMPIVDALNTQLPHKFLLLIAQLQNNKDFLSMIPQKIQKFKIHKKMLISLTPLKVRYLYQNIYLKYHSYKQASKFDQKFSISHWVENQLRVFMWLLLGYMISKKIEIRSLTQKDYQYFACIFPWKSALHLEHQVRIQTMRKNQKWKLQQAKLFAKLVKQNQQLCKWSYYSKQLFILSKRQFFKTPKQCRQRWHNYQNEAIIRTNWNEEQDLVILEFVDQYGKLWTEISKKLQHTRTQNMVKNRYNSLIKYTKREKQLNYCQEDIRRFQINRILANIDNTFKKETQLQNKAIFYQNRDSLINNTLLMQVKVDKSEQMEVQTSNIKQKQITFNESKQSEKCEVCQHQEQFQIEQMLELKVSGEVQRIVGTNYQVSVQEQQQGIWDKLNANLQYQQYPNDSFQQNSSEIFI